MGLLATETFANRKGKVKEHKEAYTDTSMDTQGKSKRKLKYHLLITTGST